MLMIQKNVLSNYLKNYYYEKLFELLQKKGHNQEEFEAIQKYYDKSPSSTVGRLKVARGCSWVEWVMYVWGTECAALVGTPMGCISS